MIYRLLKIMSAVVLVAALSACSSANKNLAGEPTTPGTPKDFAVNVGTTVHFLTDSAQLTEQGQGILRGQVKWLNKYSTYTVTLEGHADERGTREYNLALGGRRAETVKNFLLSNGISPARLRTISYGKERPVAICDDISCWSQNRRVETRLNSGGS